MEAPIFHSLRLTEKESETSIQYNNVIAFNSSTTKNRLRHLKISFLQLKIESQYGSDEIKIKLFSINKKITKGERKLWIYWLKARASSVCYSVALPLFGRGVSYKLNFFVIYRSYIKIESLIDWHHWVDTQMIYIMYTVYMQKSFSIYIYNMIYMYNKYIDIFGKHELIS